MFDMFRFYEFLMYGFQSFVAETKFVMVIEALIKDSGYVNDIVILMKVVLNSDRVSLPIINQFFTHNKV